MSDVQKTILQSYKIGRSMQNPKLQDMTIGGNRIRFLHEIILDSSRFMCSADYSEIQATFFPSTNLTITLRASKVFGECTKYAGDLAHVGFIEADAVTDDIMRSASLFLRDSKTLKSTQISQTSDNGCLLLDRGSFVYVSKNGGDQFLRTIILQMYAEAIGIVINDAIKTLFNAVTANGKEKIQYAISKYEELLRFHAAYYQKYPVNIESHELTKIWDAIRDHHRLDERMADVVTKLETVALYLREERAREEAILREERIREEDKFNNKMLRQEDKNAREAERRANKRTFLISVFLTLITGLTALDTFKNPVEAFLSGILQ